MLEKDSYFKTLEKLYLYTFIYDIFQKVENYYEKYYKIHYKNSIWILQSVDYAIDSIECLEINTTKK